MAYTVRPLVTQSLERVLGIPEVARACQWIEEDQDRCVAEQIELTQLEAPTFQEQTRALAFVAKLQAAGLSGVTLDAEGNAFGLLKGRGKGPRVLVEAHLDTVFPMGSVQPVVKRDGFLYAPGVSDNTRGLAMLLSMARAMAECRVRPRGDVVFLGSTREEGIGGMEGIRAFLRQYPGGIDASLSIDSDSVANIIYEATGLKTAEYIFHGTGGHAFGAFGQVSQPLHAAGRAVAKIADLQVPESPRTTFCVSNVHGGNDAGVHAIPPVASIKINYRSNDPAQLQILESRIDAAVEAACAEETARWQRDTVTWEKKIYCDIPAGTQDAHMPMAEGLYAVLARLGMRPVFRRGGATNASIAIAMGIPALCMGSHYSPDEKEIPTFDHTLNERFPIEGAYKGVQAALLTALLCAGTGDVASILEEESVPER